LVELSKAAMDPSESTAPHSSCVAPQVSSRTSTGMPPALASARQLAAASFELGFGSQSCMMRRIALSCSSVCSTESSDLTRMCASTLPPAVTGRGPRPTLTPLYSSRSCLLSAEPGRTSACRPRPPVGAVDGRRRTVPSGRATPPASRAHERRAPVLGRTPRLLECGRRRALRPRMMSISAARAPPSSALLHLESLHGSDE